MSEKRKMLVFTIPNCPNCPAAKKVAREVAEERDDVELEELDLIENTFLGLKYQVASTPAIIIGDKAVFISTVPTKQELNEALDAS